MNIPSPWDERLEALSSTIEEPRASAGVAAVRVYVGAAILAAHALPKLGEMLSGHGHFPELVASMGFPVPNLFAWAATLAQVAGALLLMLGLGTRVAALMVVSTLGVGIVGVHWGDPFPVVEAGVAYIVVLLALLLAGGGRYSLDRQLLTSARGG